VAAEATMERRAEALAGETLEVLAERLDVESGSWIGRSKREAPEIDGEITFISHSALNVGDYVEVEITGNEGTDLMGEARITATR
jgi:ribosomal protein S12 methylthiotransferase